MRKFYWYAGMLAAGMLTFSACSDDNDPIGGGSENPIAETDGQEIRIAVANAGDGLTTKAGRPLFSSEAAQEIDKVKVVIVNGNGQIQATKLFSDWNNESTPYSEDGHGREAIWKLSGDDKLSDTEGAETYRVYAIGYTSSNSLYDFSTFEGYTSGEASLPVVRTIQPTGDFYSAEEVFAGSLESITVTDGQINTTEGGNENVLTLHRQVTGVMGYFTGIPTYPIGKGDDQYIGVDANKSLDGMILRLVSTNINNRIVFDYFNANVMTNNGNNATAMYVVNGMRNGTIDKNAPTITSNTDGLWLTQENTAHLLYEISLKDWFPLGDVNADGVLDENDATISGGWNTPASVDGATFAPGSVFAGNFLIPFEAIRAAENPATNTTLQLQLIKEVDGTTYPVRVWDIRLAQDDPQVDPDGQHVYAVEQTGSKYVFEPQTDVNDTRDYYSLVRNHLYTVGEKGSDIYDPDTDEPEDLSKGMNLILKVNDNWEMIHKMVVD